MKEVVLPSSAVLKIYDIPFAPAKALYQALLRELKSVEVSSKKELISLYKDLFTYGFSSQEIEKCLWECIKMCTYNSGAGELKITQQTFEPISAREDYMAVCMEVGKEVIAPFTKSLYAEYEQLFSLIMKAESPK